MFSCSGREAGHGKASVSREHGGNSQWDVQDGPFRDGGTAARRRPGPVTSGPAARRDNPQVSDYRSSPVNLPEPRADPPFGMPRTMSVPLVMDTQNRLFWRIGNWRGS